MILYTLEGEPSKFIKKFNVYFRIDFSDVNLPEVIATNMKAQAIEIARRCVQPPLKKNPKFVILNLRQRSIKYIGVNIWNHFVDKLHTNCSIYVYKHHLKMFLLRNEVLN